MTPLIYGYRRATDDLDDEIRQRGLDLEKLADAFGHQRVDRAGGFRQRALRTPIVMEGTLT